MDQHLWRLARTPPGGWPQPADFSWQREPVPQPGSEQILTRTIYLSMDPYQWGRRRSGTEKPGDICHGRTVSQVIASRNGPFSEGDYIFNTNGWQEYGLTGKGISEFGYMHPRKLDPGAAPLSTAIGAMGMLGLTAYAGCYVQCQPRPGETVVISAASGGVGQVAGQIARIMGCRVVGIAGRNEKCRYVVDELGFDACVSHLGQDYPDALRTACPDGVDIYFENVGGRVFEGVLPLLNREARISLCGMISQYGNTDGRDSRQIWNEAGEKVFAAQGVKVHGLFVGNFVDRHQDEFLHRMGDWISTGEVRYKQDLWQGLAQAPAAFSAMLRGDNFGKTLVQVSPEQAPDAAGQANPAGTSATH
jgi:NADPH-dependent curcumin reductase CurA